MKNLKLRKINEKFKISEYLKKKNITPDRQSEGRKEYRCPFPDHPGDNTPSFFVYDKGNHEDCYCYGCQKGGGFVNFVSYFEQMSFSQVLRKYAEDLNIDIESEFEEILLLLKSDAPDFYEKDALDLCLDYSLFISNLCHDKLKEKNFNKDVLEKLEKIYQIVDNYVFSKNYRALEEIKDHLPEKLKEI